MTIDPGHWLQAAGALAAVLVLSALLPRGLRAGGLAPRSGRRLAVQEVLAVDARRRLLLLRCDGREVLLLTGGAQDAVLGWLPRRRAHAGAMRRSASACCWRRRRCRRRRRASASTSARRASRAPPRGWCSSPR